MTAARCINALTKAAGRELTDEELAAVFGKIQSTARDLAAGRDTTGIRAKALKPTENVIRQAAEIEAQTLIADRARAKANAYRQVSTIAARKADVAAMVGGKVSNLDAVRRLIVNDADGRTNEFSLEARTMGVETHLRSKLVDTWDALGRDFFRSFEDAQGQRNLIREMKGEDTGDARAKAGAKGWLDLAEYSRQWFNSLGGHVGKLEDWGLPQHHSQELVAKAGQAQWLADVMPMIDRSRYVEIDGTPMTDAQVRDFLSAAWDTISTNGANKIEPGKFQGSGARSNRGSQERQIHFKDAASVIDYWSRYGDKTLPQILMGHVDGIAKDIALLEHFGPNPDATFRMLRDEAFKAQVEANRTKIDKAESQLSALNKRYDYASGKVLPVANRKVARGFQLAQNLNVAGKLGSAFISSLFGDKVMFEALSQVNSLPAMQRWYNEVRLLNPANAAERRALRRQGLMLDYMANSLARYGEELAGGATLDAKLANSVVRVSGLAAVNEWRRGAWALTAMDTLGHMVSTKDFGKVGSDDMRMLGSYGITESDWKVWKLAQLDDLGHGNKTALTQEGIGRITDADLIGAGLATDAESAAVVRRDAIVKLLGALSSESRLAVLEPGWNQRARQYAGLQRGNVRDELMRSIYQFKSFPIAQFETMLDIALSRPTTAGKAGYLAAFPILTTLTGAMMVQVQDLLGGKDTRPMMDWKFWSAAALKGGTLGLYGDFIYSNSGTTRYGTGLEALAGPTIGSAFTAATFAVQAANKMGEDPESWPKAAARGLGIAKGFVPGQNLWFSKLVTDHLIFQTAQEFLNPGYLQAMEDRTYNEFGQEWWAPPGASFDELRAPNMGRALESR